MRAADAAKASPEQRAEERARLDAKILHETEEWDGFFNEDVRPAPRRGADVIPFPLVAIRDIPEIIATDWLVEGLLPRFPEGAAGYLFAPAKARKSLLISDLAISIASGTPVMGRYAVRKPGAVVGFFAEDPKGETSRRVHRIARDRGIDVPANLQLIDLPRLAIDDPDQQLRLLATLQSVSDLAFVFFDPMVRLHRINDNRAEEIGPIHGFMRELSRSLPGAVILLAHHANKEGGSRGSTDYDAFGDFNLFARKKDAHTTEVHNVELRGAPPARAFRFHVEDGSCPSGPTMKLVHSWIAEDDQDRGTALEQEIGAFRAMNPGAAGRDCISHLRKLGVEFSSSSFWPLWKSSTAHRE